MIAVFVWIGFDFYKGLTKSSIPVVLQEQLKPLDPDFDINALESLKKRRYIKEEELDETPEITELEFSEKQASPSSHEEGFTQDEE